MAASSRGSEAAASLIRATKNPRLCNTCISSLPSRRTYAAAAAQLKPSEPSPSASPATSTELAPYTIKSGICLSRPPLLTQPLHPFESAFFFYQRRLNERLAMPFSRYFYFKKDTPLDSAWKRKAATRNGAPARDLGAYNPYSETGWNDELMVGDKVSEKKATREALVEDAMNRGLSAEEAGAEEEEVVEIPQERYTEADTAKDVKRLDRKLTRTLYLVVKNKEGKWAFPSGELVGRENLHQAAERVLVQSAGMNMNTWIVGHVPIGHYISKPHLGGDSAMTKQGEKTFFMKGRIMAGQADLKENAFGITDWKWLTKEEVQGHVGPKYFSHVKNMMAAR
ncbi:hypothetical protein VE00_03852 [Pseudogymnoascus sp. WSF 3629]|nr:hypothetical protein VE00_03852 [Pseudogymnoascus sp. WSF 3629]